MLADFPVLVLDEPGEHLEPAADALTADLLTATEGHSLVLITHRLAGLESVDEVVMIDAGRVVERGSHDQLLELSGRYSNLWWDEMRMNATPHLTQPSTNVCTDGRHAHRRPRRERFAP